MLEHLHSEPHLPERTVILGSRGFVGGSIRQRLAAAGAPVLALGSNDLDLCAKDASRALAEQLHEGDALVFVSASAPCKTVDGLMQNLVMAQSVCAALTSTTISHLVYVSSDAVYRDSSGPVRETTCADPSSLHGCMHRAREIMLQSSARCPVAILRPSLLYGAADPHNGYGPNRFRRQATAGEALRLFGEGEELRDHVLIDDVAELTYRVLAHRSRGVLNLATGQSTSFREIAERVVALENARVPIEGSPRQGAISHRHFDITATLKAFPDFRYTSLDVGLAAARGPRRS